MTDEVSELHMNSTHELVVKGLFSNVKAGKAQVYLKNIIKAAFQFDDPAPGS